MAIDVFLGGLMVICLNGQNDCPVGNLGNTAWIVKADPKATPCGWYGKEETELQLRFPTDQFFKPDGSLAITCTDTGPTTECALPPLKDYPDLCVVPNGPPSAQQLDSSLRQIAHLAEIDRRFLKLDKKALGNTEWVPTRIHFPPGIIGAGPTWLNNDKPPSPTRWWRSDFTFDDALPRELSDRLKVTYQGAYGVEVTTCDGKPLIKLKVKPFATGEITLRNRALHDIKVDTDNKTYDELGFLLWYYRLGMWKNDGGMCPLDAIVLSCYWVNSTYCAKNNAADSTHWPPVMGSAY